MDTALMGLTSSRDGTDSWTLPARAHAAQPFLPANCVLGLRLLKFRQGQGRSVGLLLEDSADGGGLLGLPGAEVAGGRHAELPGLGDLDRLVAGDAIF